MEQRGMRRREILVAGVKTFRGEGKAKQARDYVNELIRDVDPSVLVLEERSGKHGQRGSHGAGESFADKLHRSIENMAKKRNVKLRLYPATQIKQSLCSDERATWYQIEQVVAEQYGELKGYLCDKGTEQEKYWRAMFKAVALGVTKACDLR
jgi:hypothetical protein